MKEMRDGTIYVLRNRLTRKCYVGQTIQPLNKRIMAHGRSSLYAIGRAIRKYGIECFEVFQLRVPSILLNDFESKLILRLNSLSPAGYNLVPDGQDHRHPCSLTRELFSRVHRGRKLSEETKRRIAEAKLGEKNPFYGKHHSAETKQKISEANRGMIVTEEQRRQRSLARRGRRLSEETKRKLSEAMRGKSHPHTEEAKQRMSAAKKGKKFSAEHIARIAAANRSRCQKGEHNPMFGKKHSEETKAKIAAIKRINNPCRGRRHSEESRRRMSEAKRAWWAKRKVA